MAERIYTKDESGKLAPLEVEPFSTEDELQALIANNPELLDGEQVRPDDPRRWILITREKGIAESSDSNERWSLDHLIIDQDAVPTLVEVKRGSNREIRCEIVGQMLEYAAHAAQTWTASELRQTFESASDEQGLEPIERLAALLEADEEPDADAYWESVATNLAAKRLRLLFVADEIPDPLARVIEFLNAQMPQIEVLAVEIKQYRGESLQTLVPRVIGRNAALFGPSRSGARSRRKLTRDTFLQELPSKVARRVADRILDISENSGAIFFWGSAGVSIRMRCSLSQRPVSVAWLYPPGVKGLHGFANVSFGANILGYEGIDPKLLEFLYGWVDEFTEVKFASLIDVKGAKAWSVSYDVAAKHLETLTDRLTGVLLNMKEL
ncbi:MAG: hypothetical protein F4148_19945 [Caldilineaceae bacterium SB0675_bin_29]|uniref:DUF91 domain-containing protein n=1 Tax=Caldilineaceae bacterium SB0675_bin_29 TaxID=2605266 RepID=A0A6B1G9T7_9CHLR|nr:hypothetical protein [Caldilineaceae bacterium SB0675_bin_29]